MSYLINDELIYILTPKCASISIENALKNSKLKIENFNLPSTLFKERHAHFTIDQSFDRFGKKETICITRDWFSKWLSALDFIWTRIEFHTKYEPIIKWEDIDNDFIYKLFDDKFINDLHSHIEDDFDRCFKKLLHNGNELTNVNTDSYFIDVKGMIIVLVSNNRQLNNQKCTYEFDIKELDKFVDFIENKFGERLIIETYNKSSHRPNKMVINDELKQWVWDKFEKPFEKRNQLI